MTGQLGRLAHPDVLANLIAQYIVAYALSLDPFAKADVNVTVGKSIIYIPAQIRSENPPSESAIERIAIEAVRTVGYSSKWGYDPYCPDSLRIITDLNGQSSNIAAAVDNGKAGDTITKVGFATDETTDYLPAHQVFLIKLAEALDYAFKNGDAKGLGPDGKLNAYVVYENGRPKYLSEVVVGAQHEDGINLELFRGDITKITKECAGELYDPSRTAITTNGADLFFLGGPRIDTGVKGKKDGDAAYGNFIGHTGGSAYGKDPTKVDLYGLMGAREAAKLLISKKLAHAARVDLSYVMGRSEPVISINSFGTSELSEAELTDIVRKEIDLTPAGVIKRLNLRNPDIYPAMARSFFGNNGPLPLLHRSL